MLFHDHLSMLDRSGREEAIADQEERLLMLEAAADPAWSVYSGGSLVLLAASEQGIGIVRPWIDEREAAVEMPVSQQAPRGRRNRCTRPTGAGEADSESQACLRFRRFAY